MRGRKPFILAGQASRGSFLSLDRGFSSIEMLICLVITLVMACLVYPALKKASDTARSASCASQLRQIYIASSLYSADNGMSCVLWRNAQALYWNELLLPYLTNNGNNPALAFWCPGDPNPWKSNRPPYPPISYGINFYPAGNTEVGVGYFLSPLKLAQIQQPSQMPYFADEDTGTAGTIYISDSPLPSDSFRHNGKANVIFMDGHVEAMTWQELLPLEQRSAQQRGWN